MSFKHRNKAFSNRAMANHADCSTDMIVDLVLLLFILAFQHFHITLLKNYYEYSMPILEFIKQNLSQ
jgi:hypothetical protein